MCFYLLFRGTQSPSQPVSMIEMIFKGLSVPNIAIITPFAHTIVPLEFYWNYRPYGHASPATWRCCTIVQYHPRRMRCSILQLKRATRSSHALTIVSADKRLPFDSQSAQYLFSSRASKELRTVWYLSTSFTDLPVIMVNWFTSSTAPLRSVQMRPESARLCVCARIEPLRRRRAPLLFLLDVKEERVSPQRDDCLSANQNAGCWVIGDAHTPVKT